MIRDGLRFRHEHDLVGWGLVVMMLSLGLASCGPARTTRRRISTPPALPIRVALTEVTQPTAHSLSFIPGMRGLKGIELLFELFDSQGRQLVVAKRRCGPLFDKRVLSSRRRFRLPLIFAEDKRLRVVRRTGMGAVPQRSTVDLARAVRARLLGVTRCEIKTYRWHVGMPVPVGVSHVPQEGEQFEGLTCGRPLMSAKLHRTFRYERVADAEHASLQVGLEFNRDYERGLKILFELIDKNGRALPGCLLRVKQPTVWEGQRKRYGIDVTGAPLVRLLRRLDHLRVKRLEKQGGPVDHYIDVRLICRGVPGSQVGRSATSGRGLGQPGVSPTYRRGTTILP
ncbi:MAG: hypothetical protein KAI47_15210 [Deltaproteobacteria bacterium]|nr:hypothetical protein [Deltaproteobacteria bacterium]